MTTDAGAELIWFGMALVLVVSAFMAQRVPLSTSLKMALAWAGIFAVGFLVVWGWQLVR